MRFWKPWGSREYIINRKKLRRELKIAQLDHKIAAREREIAKEERSAKLSELIDRMSKQKADALHQISNATMVLESARDEWRQCLESIDLFATDAHLVLKSLLRKIELHKGLFCGYYEEPIESLGIRTFPVGPGNLSTEVQAENAPLLRAKTRRERKTLPFLDIFAVERLQRQKEQDEKLNRRRDQERMQLESLEASLKLLISTQGLYSVS